MRRPARGEQSAFSLFPFLAVLLCTMGAMVVLLVAMAHVSRAKAARAAEAAAIAAAETAKAAEDDPRREALEQQLAAAQEAADKLREIKQQGAERLAQEQQRLADLEDHLRRLRDEAETLIAESNELFAVEDEHYDDEKIAQQELERLNELKNVIEDEIEELKYAAQGRERRFAVVPLRDKATGTLRPPVYLECTADGVTLQPEGTVFVWEDLVAAKFSSPLNAATRAVMQYYEENPEARAANEVGRPYPLLIVRPDGVTAYYQARSALDEAGIDYGYQPIAADWPLEYDPINPVLARWIDDAVAVARAERVGLARMIPQLATAMARAEYDAQSESDPDATGGMATVAGGSNGIRVRRADPEANNPFEGLRIEGTPVAAGTGEGAPGEGSPYQPPRQGEGQQAEAPLPPNAQLAGPAAGQPVNNGVGEGGDSEAGPVGVAVKPPGTSEAETESGPEQPEGPGQRYGSAAVANSGVPSDGQASSPTNGAEQPAGGSPSNAVVAEAADTNASDGQSQGPQGGKRSRSRRGMAMVRPIRLYVAGDRVVVLPDRAPSPGSMNAASYASQTVQFAGATSERINEVIAVLKRHAESWGIAGQGMYWDPRLILNVAGDGAGRARELRTLLEAAGLQVMDSPASTADAAPTSGGNRATRR